MNFTNQQIADHLKEIRELVSIPERWTQGSNARNKEGSAIPPTHGRAVCWCVNGASSHILNLNESKNNLKHDSFYLRYEAMKKLAENVPESATKAFDVCGRG